MEGNVWQAAADDATIVRYLLGQLPDAERDHFEDRYFVNEALHEQLQAIEEELIDAYVDGELTGEDLTCFERLFIGSPEREHKILFAKFLRTGADRLAHLGRIRSISSEIREPENVPGAFGAIAALVGRPSPQGDSTGLSQSGEMPGIGGMEMPLPVAKRGFWRSLLSIFVPPSFGIPVAFAAATAALLVGIVTVSYLWRTPLSPAMAKVDQPFVSTPATANEINTGKLPSPTAGTHGRGVRSHPSAGVAGASGGSAQKINTEVGKASPGGVLEQPSATMTPPKLPPILTFALVTGTRGEGDGNTVSLPPGAILVRLKMALEADDFDRYNAVVETADGKEIWEKHNVSPQSPPGKSAYGRNPQDRSAKVVLVDLSSALLNPGDYILKLKGVSLDAQPEVVAGYSFQVRRIH